MSDQSYINAALANELPGGLPGVFQCDQGVWFTPGTYGMEVQAEQRIIRIPLPGPTNLNAAGLLVRLAESLGDPARPTRPPALTWDSEQVCWRLAGVAFTSDPEHEAWGYNRQLVVPGLPEAVRNGSAPPAVMDQQSLVALAALVTWCGLLHGVARLAGVPPVVGEWPEWYNEGHGTWLLCIAGEPRRVFTPELSALATIGDDPAASLLTSMWEHLEVTDAE